MIGLWSYIIIHPWSMTMFCWYWRCPKLARNDDFSQAIGWGFPKIGHFLVDYESLIDESIEAEIWRIDDLQPLCGGETCRWALCQGNPYWMGTKMGNANVKCLKKWKDQKFLRNAGWVEIGLGNWEHCYPKNDELPQESPLLGDAQKVGCHQVRRSSPPVN